MGMADLPHGLSESTLIFLLRVFRKENLVSTPTALDFLKRCQENVEHNILDTGK